MSKPTEDAKFWFKEAKRLASLANGHRAKYPITADDHLRHDMALATAVGNLARGLFELSVGLRATYMLLEEVKGRTER